MTLGRRTVIEFTQSLRNRLAPAFSIVHRPFASLLGSMRSAVCRPSVRDLTDRVPPCSPVFFGSAEADRVLALACLTKDHIGNDNAYSYKTWTKIVISRIFSLLIWREYGLAERLATTSRMDAETK
jgi:hypothetical protein